jgi:hypothetical protein
MFMNYVFELIHVLSYNIILQWQDGQAVYYSRVYYIGGWHYYEKMFEILHNSVNLCYAALRAFN